MKNKIFKRYAMYKEYGENYGSICRNCCNFCQYEFDGRRYNKCIALEWTKRMILHGMAVGRDVVCTICRKTEH